MTSTMETSMKLTRTLMLFLAVTLPTSWTIAHAEDAPAAEAKPKKKAKKKKAEEPKKEEAPK
jgi:ribosomal protein L12E/L44/L45/RPP1/RPP2